MKQGFTLLELAVVLAIIGLLAGGIVVGSSMIRAAELRAVLTELSTYRTAVHTFSIKYHSLPGDMHNATEFWGDNASVCSDGDAANNGSPGTCNGDGDGIIKENAPAASEPMEGFMMWNQLALADMISGTYTGISGPGGDADSLIGVNDPASKLSGGCWHIEDDFAPNNPHLYVVDYSPHYLEFGMDDGIGDCDLAIFTPEEAWNLDKKADDGVAHRGNILATVWDDLCTDAGSATDFDSDYSLSDDTVQCALIFQNIF